MRYIDPYHDVSQPNIETTKKFESDWSDPLPITMPLDVESGYALLLKQVHQSPNVYLLLRQLLVR